MVNARTKTDQAQCSSDRFAFRLHSMDAGGGTVRYFVEARPPEGGCVRLDAPQGFVVASWRASDTDGEVRGQWISPFPDLYAVIDMDGSDLCRIRAEPASIKHRSLIA